jgi:hypothetical protein
MSVRDGQNINGESGKTLYLWSSGLYAISDNRVHSLEKKNNVTVINKYWLLPINEYYNKTGYTHK